MDPRIHALRGAGAVRVTCIAGKEDAVLDEEAPCYTLPDRIDRVPVHFLEGEGEGLHSRGGFLNCGFLVKKYTHFAV